MASTPCPVTPGFSFASGGIAPADAGGTRGSRSSATDRACGGRSRGVAAFGTPHSTQMTTVLEERLEPLVDEPLLVPLELHDLAQLVVVGRGDRELLPFIALLADEPHHEALAVILEREVRHLREHRVAAARRVAGSATAQHRVRGSRVEIARRVGAGWALHRVGKGISRRGHREYGLRGEGGQVEQRYIIGGAPDPGAGGAPPIDGSPGTGPPCARTCCVACCTALWS